MPDRTTDPVDALLPRIGALLTRYGSGLQPPCPPERLVELRARCAAELGAELPEGYAALLARTDGLNWDGAVINASHRAPVVGHPGRRLNDVVEMNLIWRDHPSMAAWFVCGESNLDLYALHLATGRFHVLEQVPTHSFEAYDTFAELFEAAYRDRL